LAAPLKCLNCGAPPLGNESRFCTYCGSELSSPEEAPRESASPTVQLEARFAALRDYPTFDELCAYVPPTSAATVGLYGQVIGGGFFTVVATGMTLAFATFAGPMAVVPGIMVVLGVWMTISGLRTASSFTSSPLRSLPATVLGERVKVSGGGKNSSASTRYFAMVQDEEGNRKEYAALEKVASKVVANDIGVAFVKGEYLVEFLVVPV
jgi:hypothetical protein